MRLTNGQAGTQAEQLLISVDTLPQVTQPKTRIVQQHTADLTLSREGQHIDGIRLCLPERIGIDGLALRFSR